MTTTDNPRLRDAAPPTYAVEYVPAGRGRLVTTRDVFAIVRDAFIIAFCLAVVVFGATVVRALGDASGGTAGTAGIEDVGEFPQPYPMPTP